MMLVLLIFIYTLINYYLCTKVILWFSKFDNILGSNLIKIIIGIIYFICFISVLTGYFLRNSKFQKKIQKFANVFTGMLFYMILIALFSDLIRLISVNFLNVSKDVFFSNKYAVAIGTITILVVVGLSIYGYFHAKKITIKHYDITINGKKIKRSNLRIILVADFHLGYSVGYEMMEKMKDKINEQYADIVLIAGDIFDNSAFLADNMNKCENALKEIKSRFGTYAVYGNHDVEEKLLGGFPTTYKKIVKRDKEMEKILQRANIKVLNDQVIQIEDFYIVGRKDYEKTGEENKYRLPIDKLLNKVQKNKFIIVLEHEPKHLKKLSKFPIDLHLAGHTHAGQYFPINIGTRLVWKNHYGIKKINNMTSIVTSGIGVYGPNMRVGTNSEIAIIDVTFNKTNN